MSSITDPPSPFNSIFCPSNRISGGKYATGSSDGDRLIPLGPARARGAPRPCILQPRATTASAASFVRAGRWRQQPSFPFAFPSLFSLSGLKRLSLCILCENMRLLTSVNHESFIMSGSSLNYSKQINRKKMVGLSIRNN